MIKRIIKHGWKPFLVAVTLLICSNVVLAFDRYDSVRQKMSKGDVITNTDSIDFLFKIDRGKPNYNCFVFENYDDEVACYVAKDSLEELILNDIVEIDGVKYYLVTLFIGEPYLESPRYYKGEHATPFPFVKLKRLVIPNTVVELSNLQRLLSLETITIEQSPDSCYYLDEYYPFLGYCPNLQNVILPEGIDCLPEESFSECYSLKEVVLPQSLKWIDDDCFIGCTQLEKINIPNNVCKIGGNSFKDCSNLKEIILPQSLEAIERNCFNGCTNLEKVYIPANVKEIDNTAFVNCPNLKEIIIDSNNPYYDSRDNCNAIIDSRTNTLIRACSTSTIPKGVQIIAKHAFFDCNVLSVTIPESVTTICDLAFENSSIQELNIPASVDSIGMAICAVCRSLNKITVDKKNKKYDSRKGCNAIIRTADNTLITASNNAYIPNGVEVIGSCAFICSGITNIYIPQSVKKVEMQAFAGCISLDKITVDKRNKVYYSENNCLIKDKTLVAGCSKSVIPSDITTIGAFAFRYIPLYWKLDIPDNITEIQSHAFSECTTIDRLTLPDSLSILGDYAFASCNNLTSVVINSVDKFGEGAFYACNQLYNVSFTSPIDSLGRRTFSNCLNLKSIVLPKGMTYIGYCAFGGCSNLEYVGFPSTLEKISDGSFEYCKSLKTICLPNNLRYIGYDAFLDCNSLTELDFPESLPANLWAYDRAFIHCKNLETVKLPLLNFQNGVYTYTFECCTKLKKVILK